MATKKIIDIEVDSSKVEKALKSTINIDSNTKKILATNKAILKVVTDILSKQASSASTTSKTTTELKKQKKVLEEIDRLKERESKRLKDYNRQKAKEDFQLQIDKREFEKPNKSLLEQYQKYKGASGTFTRLAEMRQESGQIEIDKYNKQLLEQRQDREDMMENLKQTQKAREDLETKGVYNPATKRWRKATQADRDAADKAIEDAQKRLETQDEEIRKTERKKSKSIGETKTEVNKYAAMAQAASKAEAAIAKMGKAILDFAIKPFKDLKDAVVANVTAMLDLRSGIATFSTGSSLITNATAREQQMKYGLTTSQNYAFTQAKSMLGIQSDEDLMYMNASQRDRLLSYMERYSQWYDELESSGVLDSIQEMQLEFEELKQELAMEFLTWIANNKDTIMFCIKSTFEFVKAIANFIMKIITLIGGSSDYDLYNSANASDRINNDSHNVSTNVTINANTTNNATGVLGSQEALDKFNDENWSKLAKQIVGVIGG